MRKAITFSWQTVMLCLFAMACAMVVLTLTNCATPPPAPQPPAADDPCGKACEHQRGMGCVLGTPTPKGVPCETVCRDNAKSGFDWPTQCLASASDCSEEC